MIYSLNAAWQNESSARILLATRPHVNNFVPAPGGGTLSMRVHLDVGNPNEGLGGVWKHVTVDFVNGHKKGADLDPLCL